MKDMPTDPSSSGKSPEQPRSTKRFGDDLPQEMKDEMGPDFELMAQRAEAARAEYLEATRRYRKKSTS